MNRATVLEHIKNFIKRNWQFMVVGGIGATL